MSRFMNTFVAVCTLIIIIYAIYGQFTLLNTVKLLQKNEEAWLSKKQYYRYSKLGECSFIIGLAVYSWVRFGRSSPILIGIFSLYHIIVSLYIAIKGKINEVSLYKNFIEKKYASEEYSKYRIILIVTYSLMFIAIGFQLLQDVRFP